ncbi:MAG: hypothetical protein RJB24_155 [Candidatus Parcubacteria bacterium]
MVFEKDRQTISNIIDFHWVVSGESGRIVNLTMNKIDFNRGEEAIIDMQLADRADLHFSQGEIKSLGEVKLLTTLSCSNNYQKNVENIININDNRNLQVKIPVDKNVQDCTVKTDLSKDDTQLHSKVLAYTQEDTIDTVNNKSNENNLITFLLLALVLIALIGGTFFFIIKKKNINAKLLLIPLLFIFWGIGYDNALAGHCTAVSIVISSPQPSPMEYEYGQTIPLKGNAVVTYCTNYPADLKLSFYLDDNPSAFYSRDYYVPAQYSHWYSGTTSTESIEFGIESISDTPLSPGWHKVRMDWFQDCTRQNEGKASGSVTRWFYVKSPEPTFRIQPMDLRVRVGDKLAYQSYYDEDGVASQSEQNVTSTTNWIIGSNIFLRNLGKGQFEALSPGISTVTANYSGKSITGNITVIDEKEPYLEIKADKNILIYPETTAISATLVEFDEDGSRIETEIDDKFNIRWQLLPTNFIEIIDVDNGLATIKGRQDENGFTQIRGIIRKDGKNIIGLSNPIQTKTPKLRVDPSNILTNSDPNINKEIQFRALFDHDGDSSTPEQDISSNSSTIWSLPLGSPLTNLTNGKFNIPARIIGNYPIFVRRGIFSSQGNLDLQGVATPMESDIIVELNKDRKIIAVATSRGGKFPYTYTNWNLIGEDNQPVRLERSAIVSNTSGNSGGNKVEFNVHPSVIAPQKMRIQVESIDSGGASDNPFKEIRYFGDTNIREVNP